MSVVPIKPLELMKDPNITKSEFKDFIGVWDNFVPESLCNKIIKFYEDYTQNAAISMSSEIADGEEQFSEGKLGRSDISILLNDSSRNLSAIVNQYLQAATTHYIDKYPQLKSSKLISGDIKMQKTPPEGGYHIWHYETAGYHSIARELVWIIYLNDMPDGEGETEFMYQRRRIKPTTGTVVIWPAAMTHVHRGLTVYTQDKYILTGWYIKVP